MSRIRSNKPWTASFRFSARVLPGRPGQCSECAGQQGIVVAYDEATARRALDSSAGEACPRCGRAVTVIRVVYDGDEDEGGGGY